VIGAGTVIDKNVQEGSVVYRKSQLIKKDKK
jgi:bifunctional N-acetylglucosamine-1-phosphate-uridyltransferase/glucosamine-1-phosphate-acetyltransferase GlmU-like protein